MKAATPRQREVLDCVMRHLALNHHHPPTQREIGEALGIGHGGVRLHLAALERKGFIEYGSADGCGSRSTPSRTLRVLRTAEGYPVRVLDGGAYFDVCDAALVDDPSGDLCDDCVDEEEGE